MAVLRIEHTVCYINKTRLVYINLGINCDSEQVIPGVEVYSQ